MHTWLQLYNLYIIATPIIDLLSHFICFASVVSLTANSLLSNNIGFSSWTIGFSSWNNYVVACWHVLYVPCHMSIAVLVIGVHTTNAKLVCHCWTACATCHCPVFIWLQTRCLCLTGISSYVGRNTLPKMLDFDEWALSPASHILLQVIIRYRFWSGS